ncbi:Na+/H+ antiporter NhaC family protein [Liberiplasma polymorphum]|uniref:Na+/H+ antiporter NhaC family protein n=1 Tax=Liberiplasma polymorphum TaxID=3374570 RepID=UPI003776A7D3
MDLFIALLPALLMITLVILTRKVLLSLGLGVILAALIYESFSIFGAVGYLASSLWGILTDFEWYMPIVGFVLLIGAITAVISLTGGIRAFADWAVEKVTNPVAAKMLTWVLGIIIFIDDYFNALVIGEISKPITDKYKVSRAKLAYIIDSTSAPVVILMPISTWGAYIILLIGDAFNDSGYTAHTGFTGFLSAIPFQFYPIIAVLMVFLTIKYGINIGPMKEFEEKSLTGDDVSRVMDAEVVQESDIEGTKATHWTLIIPIGLLVFVTIFWMFLNAGFVPSAFMDQDITIPLFLGGLSAYIAALVFAFIDKDVKPKSVAIVSAKGTWGMAKGAVAILILAWMVSGAIQDLEVGGMLATIIADSNLAASFLPLILFIIAAGIAFATGTSWGSFGILIPIAVPIAVATNPLFMPAILAAVLGGAVVGDHSSPVSDTTVLSATGARCTLHAHFISQLPYVAIATGIAAIGYLVFGVTQLLIVSYIVMAPLVFLYVYITRKKDLHVDEEV